MCTLAHYLESYRIPTVAISLVRMHAQKIRPPRSLFVPFELGRPLGDPDDADTQRAVLRQALHLLEQPLLPPILVDYPDPPARPDPDWQPAVQVPDPGDGHIGALALKREYVLVRPAYERAVAARGRTTVGNSGLNADAVVDLICRLMPGGPEPTERTSSKIIRFAVDDLKAIYTEAASLGEPAPTSWQIGDWFWRRTAAGAALVALRAAFLASGDTGRETAGGRMFVPTQWLDELGL